MNIEKIKLQLADLIKATSRLQEAIDLPSTIINQDACIKRFEISFELAWKLLQSMVRENGIEIYGPKNAIREAAKLGLINEVERWFEFLEARNLTVHTYEEKIAQIVYQKSKLFTKYLQELVNNAKRYLATSS